MGGECKESFLNKTAMIGSPSPSISSSLPPMTYTVVEQSLRAPGHDECRRRSRRSSEDVTLRRPNSPFFPWLSPFFLVALELNYSPGDQWRAAVQLPAGGIYEYK